MKQFFFLLYLLVASLASCTLSQDTKFYADKSSSIEVTMHIDPSLSQKMSAGNQSNEERKVHGKSIDELPKDWVSFYDLGMYDTVKTMQNDTVKALLKKFYIKYIIESGSFVGFSMKAERLKGNELEEFGNHFSKLNPGKSSDSLKPKLAAEPVPEWDGKTMTLKIGADKGDESTEKKKNQKGSESQNIFASLFKDANIVLTYRYSFEKKIKKIQGKHDFFKKLDDHTVVYELDFKKLMEMSEKGKSLKKKDRQIILLTE